MKERESSLSTLAGRIRWIIAENGLKQAEFARAMGISANYVYLLTSGKKKTVSKALAKLIGVTYGVSPQWLTKGEPIPKSPKTSDLRTGTMRKIKRMDVSSLRSVAAFIRSMDEADHESNINEKRPSER